MCDQRLQAPLQPRPLVSPNRNRCRPVSHVFLRAGVELAGGGATGFCTKRPIGRAGTPATVTPGGTSLITTALAPIRAPWPTSTSPRMTAPRTDLDMIPDLRAPIGRVQICNAKGGVLANDDIIADLVGHQNHTAEMFKLHAPPDNHRIGQIHAAEPLGHLVHGAIDKRKWRAQQKGLQPHAPITETMPEEGPEALGKVTAAMRRKVFGNQTPESDPFRVFVL